MLSNPAEAAGLVTREVRTGSRDGAPTKIAVARRTYATDQADLWDVLTNAERIPRWFLPVTGELRVGGRYQLQGNAGGTVERCEAPKLLALTWEWEKQVSWVRVNLTPDGAGTLLELEHESPVDAEVWGTYGPGAVGLGWDLVLMALGLHLASGEPVDPAEGMAFPTTPDGKTFVRAAATSWADAAVKDGEDPAAARAAAARTVGFYTGEPEEGAGS